MTGEGPSATGAFRFCASDSPASMSRGTWDVLPDSRSGACVAPGSAPIWLAIAPPQLRRTSKPVANRLACAPPGRFSATPPSRTMIRTTLPTIILGRSLPHRHSVSPAFLHSRAVTRLSAGLAFITTSTPVRQHFCPSAKAPFAAGFPGKPEQTESCGLRSSIEGESLSPSAPLTALASNPAGNLVIEGGMSPAMPGSPARFRESKLRELARITPHDTRAALHA